MIACDRGATVDFTPAVPCRRGRARPYSKVEHDRTVVALIDELGIKDCGLVGHSMGGAAWSARTFDRATARRASCASWRAGALGVAVSKVVLTLFVLIASSALAGCGIASATWTYAPASATAAAPAASASPVGSAAASPSASTAPAPSASATPAASEAAPSSANPSGSVPAENTIELQEWKVTMPTEVRAGKVTYTIKNTGAEVHELIGFRSALDPVSYPRQKNGDVNEEGKGITSVTDGPNLDPGGTETRTIDLTTPGKYTFMCNITGHFENGMYIVVTVSP